MIEITDDRRGCVEELPIPAGIDLADVAAAIRGATNVEEWWRDELLIAARALASFYERHRAV
jgi:hypothetical protein